MIKWYSQIWNKGKHSTVFYFTDNSILLQILCIEFIWRIVFYAFTYFVSWNSNIAWYYSIQCYDIEILDYNYLRILCIDEKNTYRIPVRFVFAIAFMFYLIFTIWIMCSIIVDFKRKCSNIEGKIKSGINKKLQLSMTAEVEIEKVVCEMVSSIVMWNSWERKLSSFNVVGSFVHYSILLFLFNEIDWSMFECK